MKLRWVFSVVHAVPSQRETGPSELVPKAQTAFGPVPETPPNGSLNWQGETSSQCAPSKWRTASPTAQTSLELLPQTSADQPIPAADHAAPSKCSVSPYPAAQTSFELAAQMP